MMRFAYADPPYLGCGALYAKHHPEAKIWDDIETHQLLVEQLQDEFPDGWLMSTNSVRLRAMLAICPDDVRIGAWVKPFAGNVYAFPAYAWEPLIFRGGRKQGKPYDPGSFERDWISANTPRGRGDGFHGRKPRSFCRWLFRMMNAKPGDEFVDLFPGTGIVGAAWQEWSGDRTQPDFELT